MNGTLMGFRLLGGALLAVAILSPDSGSVHAAERGPWYIGAGVVRSNFSVNASQLNSILSSIQTTENPETHESGASGGRIYGGIRLNRFFALEAGYVDLGDIAVFVPDRPRVLAVAAPGHGLSSRYNARRFRRN